jgi:hypothetical protein
MTGLAIDPVGGWWLVAAAALVLAPLLVIGPNREGQSPGGGRFVLHAHVCAAHGIDAASVLEMRPRKLQ